MSELKAFDIVVSEEGYFEGIVKYRRAVYDKSEADKVIAELKNKLDLYKRGSKEDDKINAYLYAELRHQKYKRCMAMMKYCEYRFMNLEKISDTGYRTKKMWLSHRWWVKWLKLADKFKEAK